VTKLRLSDLPPKVREQIAREQGVPVRKAKSRKGTSDRVPCPGRCGTCGERFPDAHQWELHVDAVHGGCGRWDIDFD
jgi:hypothetical protein